MWFFIELSFCFIFGLYSFTKKKGEKYMQIDMVLVCVNII